MEHRAVVPLHTQMFFLPSAVLKHLERNAEKVSRHDSLGAKNESV